MRKFELVLLDGLPPNLQVVFYKLYVDQKCLFDDFWIDTSKGGNLSSDMEKVQTIITHVAEGRKVPTKWFDELKYQNRPSDDPYKDFEIRAGRLRVFLFEDIEEGVIIVTGQVKKSEKEAKKEIAKMRKLKQEYFHSKQ